MIERGGLRRAHLRFGRSLARALSFQGRGLRAIDSSCQCPLKPTRCPASPSTGKLLSQSPIRINDRLERLLQLVLLLLLLELRELFLVEEVQSALDSQSVGAGSSFVVRIELEEEDHLEEAVELAL
jgi:hypothetical protein